MNIDDGIVVLSTFNGMSCGMMAFESLGIKVKKYYSVEIDKHANKISNILYPNIIQLVMLQNGNHGILIGVKSM